MVARHTSAVLREAAGRHPRDKALQAVIGELSVASPEFRTWWADHDGDTRCHGLKRFQHPVVGGLSAHIETLQLQDRERWLVTYTVELGTPPPDDALRLLGTWAATQDAEEEQAARLSEPARTLRPR